LKYKTNQDEIVLFLQNGIRKVPLQWSELMKLNWNSRIAL